MAAGLRPWSRLDARAEVDFVPVISEDAVADIEAWLDGAPVRVLEG